MDQSAVFRHARALQQATTLSAVGRVAAEAVHALTRYRHSWLALLEVDDPKYARIIEVSSTLSDVILEHCPRVPVDGDPMMRELLEKSRVIVVDDARLDPRTNKAIVEQLGNRTLINVPMSIADTVLGSLGLGTFGDEGVMPPTEDELDALLVFSVQLAAAFERVRSTEKARQVEQERATLERRLESLQRVELMGVMASGVAHDLRNILTVLRSSVDLLSEGPDPEVAADAREALDRAADVCGQLLALGRTARKPVQEVDLDARLEATLRLVRPAMPSGVTVKYERRPHPAVTGDPVQLDQAFANLILNARDAVGERGTIHVVTDAVTFDEAGVARSRWARPGHYARVAVQDDGCGIPPDLLEHIFEPLVTTKQQGTGLGLAVVSTVMKQHHGLVHCESKPGQTRFELYLPAARG